MLDLGFFGCGELLCKNITGNTKNNSKSNKNYCGKNYIGIAIDTASPTDETVTALNAPSKTAPRKPPAKLTVKSAKRR
jgi:hypothetical protein